MFGVYIPHLEQHSLHLWSEWDGCSSTDETITTILQDLETFKDSMGSGILNLIGDSCGGQNKNQYMIALTALLANPGSPFHRFGEVNMKFPWLGHMFLPNDRFFGIISKYVRDKNVNEPHQS
jgi:hypothetical protein